MSARSDGSGKVNRFAPLANVVKRASCSGSCTSLWGRGPLPSRSERSLQQAHSLSLVPLLHAHLTLQRKTAAFVGARPRRVASSSPLESRSVHRRHQLRCASSAEAGMTLGQLVATSGSVACVARVRERVSSATAFARPCLCSSQLACFCSSSVSNMPLVPTAHPLARVGTRAVGAAPAQRRR